MKICFSTFAYTEYPLSIALGEIADMGYDGVEITAIRPHAFPKDLEQRDRKKIRQLISSVDLELSAIVQPATLNFVSPIKKERIEAVRCTKDCLKLASDIGAKYTVAIPGTKILPNFGVNYEKAFRWAKEGVEECTIVAEERGVILALEPLSRLRGMVNFMYRTDEILRLIREINSKCLGVTFDVEHRTNEKEDLIESLKRIGNLKTYIHIRDTRRTPDQIMPGKGIIDFRKFLRTLTERDFDGYLTVEFWNLAEPREYALESITFLRSILRTL